MSGQSGDKICVQVKSLTGEIMPLVLYKTDTVSRLNKLITDKKSMPGTTRLNLTFGGTNLIKENNTLEEYGVQDNSTIFCVTRLIGGSSV
mmetsp:Transcript_36420/g.36036  ORF Transcript_36420/g.36036 Transcript_36420/m.36036 type:complete len:90 (+) Transcript_36420:11-280(+)